MWEESFVDRIDLSDRDGVVEPRQSGEAEDPARSDSFMDSLSLNLSSVSTSEASPRSRTVNLAVPDYICKRNLTLDQSSSRIHLVLLIRQFPPRPHQAALEDHLSVSVHNHDLETL